MRINIIYIYKAARQHFLIAILDQTIVRFDLVEIGFLFCNDF